jgi:hypothetical protein
MANGFTENVTVDEGVDHLGIRTQMHFEGDEIIVQKTYDAEPHLRYAEQARQQTAGMNWGEGRIVGHIPPVPLAKIMQLRTKEERQKAMRAFLFENNKFVMFDKFLKK